jgi:hypothetical protein
MANEILIRKYLLGGLTAEERRRIEDTYFANSDFFEELVSAENDLIDSYVRGALTPSDKQQFERQYTAPDQIAKIDFAKALAEVVESERKTENANRSARGSFASFLGLPRVQLSWVFAVVAVLIAGVSVLSVQNHRLHEEVRDARADATESRRQTDTLRAQITALSKEARLVPSSEQGREVAQIESLGDLPFRLIPGEVRRGMANQRILCIPKNGAWVRLEMLLERDEFRTYDAAFQTAEGKEVLRVKGLKSSSIRGNRVVVWRVPSFSIQPDDYVVELRGTKVDGSVEEVESYSLRAVQK